MTLMWQSSKRTPWTHQSHLSLPGRSLSLSAPGSTLSRATRAGSCGSGGKPGYRWRRRSLLGWRAVRQSSPGWPVVKAEADWATGDGVGGQLGANKVLSLCCWRLRRAAAGATRWMRLTASASGRGTRSTPSDEEGARLGVHSRQRRERWGGNFGRRRAACLTGAMS
jgi:hypothetical protein